MNKLPLVLRIGLKIICRINQLLLGSVLVLSAVGGIASNSLAYQVEQWYPHPTQYLPPHAGPLQVQANESSPIFNTSDEGAVIQDIIISGNQRIEPLTILFLLPFQIGDNYTSVDANKAVKNLMATQLFEDITIDFDGENLTITVDETPIINTIAIEKNRAISDDILLPVVTLAARQPLDRDKVRTSIQRIKAIYEARGYYAVNIEPKIIKLENNRINLVFEVYEGEAGAIRAINFIGNTNFSDRELLSLIQSRIDGFFTSSTLTSFDQNRINYDINLLTRHYLSNGFLDFQVKDSVVELASNNTDFLLTFVVVEGKQYRIRSQTVTTDIAGLDLTATQQLAEDIIATDSVYSIDEIDTFTSEATKILEQQGFFPIVISPNVTPVSDQAIVDVIFNAAIGQRVFIKEINIIGNLRTHDSVIRRELTFSEGQIFRAEDVRNSHRKLVALDYFSQIDIQPRPSSVGNEMFIDIIITEKPTGSLNFGFGYNSQFGLQGTIGFEEKNLIGKGYDAKLSITAAQYAQNYNFSFTDEGFLDRPLALGGDLFYTTTQYQNSRYLTNLLGARVNFRYPIGQYVYHLSSLELSQKKVKHISKLALNPYLSRALGTFEQLIINQTFAFNNLDNPVRPTSGIFTSIKADLGGVPEEVGYIRSEFNFNYYIPVTQNSVIVQNNRVGYIHSLLSDRATNISDRYFLGGELGVRGFADNGIGPRSRRGNIPLGSNFLWLSSLEYQFPLGLPQELGIFGTVFTDVGTLLVQAETEVSGYPIDYDSTIRTSAGLGIRWYSPFAPITLYYAWPITEANYDTPGGFGFSFQTSF